MCVQDAVVVQELVGYLQQEGHLEGQPGSGIMQAPNLDQLITLLQRSQVGTCMSTTQVAPLSLATVCSVCCPTCTASLRHKRKCLIIWHGICYTDRNSYMHSTTADNLFACMSPWPNLGSMWHSWQLHVRLGIGRDWL